MPGCPVTTNTWSPVLLNRMISRSVSLYSGLTKILSHPSPQPRNRCDNMMVWGHDATNGVNFFDWPHLLKGLVPPKMCPEVDPGAQTSFAQSFRVKVSDCLLLGRDTFNEVSERHDG